MARIEDFGKPLPAEEVLLAGLSSGEFVVIGDGKLPPEEPNPAREIRGDFLRELILDAVEDLVDYKDYRARVHEKGVRIAGAHITGTLDLEGCRIPRDIALFHCRFDAPLKALSACVDNLYLNGSVIPGITADRLEVRGSVYLSSVQAEGVLSFVNASVNGVLDCSGSALKGDPNAMCLQEAEIGGSLVVWEDCAIIGELDLTSAVLGGIVDAEESWPAFGNLILNYCRYDAFPAGRSPVDAKSRINWLSLQDPTKSGADFWPQPWEQCAKVLREMGHREDARKVLIAKEKRQRKAARARAWRAHLVRPVAVGTLVGIAGGLAVARLFGVVAAGGVFLALALFIGLDLWRWAKDYLLAITVRYGHVPLLAFVWLIGIAGLGALVFHAAAQDDAIKPNNPFILRSAEWVRCDPDYVAPFGVGGAGLNSGTGQRDCFEESPEGASYPRFAAAIYSIDTLLPIVDLEMQGYWIPDDRAESAWGWIARGYLWMHIAAGWALSLLAVAGFSGLIRSDSK